MARTRRPRLSWFRFYVDDFLGGVSALTATDTGAYVLLLLAQWGTKDQQAIEDDPEVLRMICKGVDPSKRVLGKFVQAEVGGQGCLRNERLAQEWAIAHEEVQAKSGGVRSPEGSPDQKLRARGVIGNAIRDGRLKREPCESCGHEVSFAHHDDYSRPLDVRWLCDPHHKQAHQAVTATVSPAVRGTVPEPQGVQIQDPRSKIQETDPGTGTDSTPAATALAKSLPKKQRGGSDVRAVFGHWKRVMGHPDAKLTREREAKVKARLAEGYTIEQLNGAVDGCKASPHHMGRNDTGTIYDDLELICRNGGKVESFVAKQPVPEPAPVEEKWTPEDRAEALAERDRRLDEMRERAKAERETDDRGLAEMRTREERGA